MTEKNYVLLYHPDFEKGVKKKFKKDKPKRKKLLEDIENELKQNPTYYIGYDRELFGFRKYRFSDEPEIDNEKGDYRVIFAICDECKELDMIIQKKVDCNLCDEIQDTNSITIIVFAFGDRKEVYDKVKRKIKANKPND